MQETPENNKVGKTFASQRASTSKNNTQSQPALFVFTKSLEHSDFLGSVADAQGLSVRELYIATGQYSSLCVSAVVLTLGGDDIVEVVQDREQVDSEREKGRSER